MPQAFKKSLFIQMFWSSRSMDCVKESKIAVLLVHGTFHNEKLYHEYADDIAEMFVKNFPKANLEVFQFAWDGRNSDKSRLRGASELANLLASNFNSFDTIALVGHSHGGNVAIEAVKLLSESLRKRVKVFAICTPGLSNRRPADVTSARIWTGLLILLTGFMLLTRDLALMSFFASVKNTAAFKDAIPSLAPEHDYFPYLLTNVFLVVSLLCTSKADSGISFTEDDEKEHVVRYYTTKDEVSKIFRALEYEKFIRPSVQTLAVLWAVMTASAFCFIYLTKSSAGSKIPNGEWILYSTQASLLFSSYLVATIGLASHYAGVTLWCRHLIFGSLNVPPVNSKEYSVGSYQTVNIPSGSTYLDQRSTSNVQVLNYSPNSLLAKIRSVCHPLILITSICFLILYSIVSGLIFFFLVLWKSYHNFYVPTVFVLFWICCSTWLVNEIFRLRKDLHTPSKGSLYVFQDIIKRLSLNVE